MRAGSKSPRLDQDRFMTSSISRSEKSFPQSLEIRLRHRRFRKVHLLPEFLHLTGPFLGRDVAAERHVTLMTRPGKPSTPYRSAVWPFFEPPSLPRLAS
jgi:hypothetical protein